MFKHQLLLNALNEIKRHGPTRSCHALCSNMMHANRVLRGEEMELFESQILENLLSSIGEVWCYDRGQKFTHYYWLEGEEAWDKELEDETFWSNPVRLDFLHFAIDYLEEYCYE